MLKDRARGPGTKKEKAGVFVKCRNPVVRPRRPWPRIPVYPSEVPKPGSALSSSWPRIPGFSSKRLALTSTYRVLVGIRHRKQEHLGSDVAISFWLECEQYKTDRTVFRIIRTRTTSLRGPRTRWVEVALIPTSVIHHSAQLAKFYQQGGQGPRNQFLCAFGGPCARRVPRWWPASQRYCRATRPGSRVMNVLEVRVGGPCVSRIH